MFFEEEKGCVQQCKLGIRSRLFVLHCEGCPTCDNDVITKCPPPSGNGVWIAFMLKLGNFCCIIPRIQKAFF
ncbi:hypothetical protein JHK85_056330 [Glycine max]|nr:hypothetical protein JHK85_056330 [Glycine max]